MSITELLSSHATVKDPVCCNKTQNRQINNFLKSIFWKGKRTNEKEEGRKGGNHSGSSENCLDCQHLPCPFYFPDWMLKGGSDCILEEPVLEKNQIPPALVRLSHAQIQS